MKNTLVKWILQNISENQTFRRTAKFIMIDFYKMDFKKAIFILVKVHEMYMILKSLPANREMKVLLNDQSWSLLFNVHTFTTSLLY